MKQETPASKKAKAIQVLEYLRTLEAFLPQNLTNLSVLKDYNKTTLPNDPSLLNGLKITCFLPDVILGNALFYLQEKKIIKTSYTEETNQEFESKEKITAGFFNVHIKKDKDSGCYFLEFQKNSIELAPFFIAIVALVNHDDTSDIKAKTKKWNLYFRERYGHELEKIGKYPRSFEAISEGLKQLQKFLLEVICKTFNFHDFWKNEVKQLEPKFFIEDHDTWGLSFWNSFYQEEIDKAIKYLQSLEDGVNDKLIHFLSDAVLIAEKIGTNANPSDQELEFIVRSMNKILIDRDVESLKKLTSPNMMTLAKWPNINRPSLMQQVAINATKFNRVSHRRDQKPKNPQNEQIIAVNGPPGTGKTTLLKDVIAERIVDRAIKLCNFSLTKNIQNGHGDKIDLTGIILNQNHGAQYNFISYPLPNFFKEGWIVVCSSNNKAVENISKELPLAPNVYYDANLIKTKAHINDFDNRINDEIYYTDLVNVHYNYEIDAWGFLSIPLGKKANIKSLIETYKAYFEKIFENHDDQSDLLRHQFEECREMFLQQKNLVEKLIQNAQQDFEKLKELEAMITTNQELANQQGYSWDLEDEIIKINHSFSKIEGDYEQLKISYKDVNENLFKAISQLPLLNKSLSFLQKIKKFFGSKEPEIIKQQNKIIKNAQNAVIDTKNMLEKTKLEYENAKGQHSHLQQAWMNLTNLKNKYSNLLPDDQFWNGLINQRQPIQFNENSQKQCPWVSRELDIAREKLFFLALKLHKAYVKTNKEITKNIKLLFCFLEKPQAFSEYEEHWQTIVERGWQALSFIIPVMSTTFASVGTFLKYVRPKEIGLLIIDEAGQAPASAAIGAIIRAQDVIIVGDPMQIEPITKTPKTLMREFQLNSNINRLFALPFLSVQQLADACSPYVGIINHQIVGLPLVVHRRCEELMFNVSNMISYSNRMFSAVNEQGFARFNESIWYNTTEEPEIDSHFVKQEGRSVLELISSHFKAEDFSSGTKQLYILSPFKDVIDKLKRLLIETLPKKLSIDTSILKKWLKTNVGTIHTFQGKDAQEVILVLGCGLKNYKGARWACEKPNLLNVSITRARKRLVVLGNKSVWSNLPYFKTLYKAMKNVDNPY